MIIEIPECFLKFKSKSIRETVPAPFRLSSKRNTIFIDFRKSLKACYINSESKFPVSDSQRTEGIELSDFDCMTAHKGFTVKFICIR